jgi:hypothetical protein
VTHRIEGPSAVIEVRVSSSASTAADGPTATSRASDLDTLCKSYGEDAAAHFRIAHVLTAVVVGLVATTATIAFVGLYSSPAGKALTLTEYWPYLVGALVVLLAAIPIVLVEERYRVSGKECQRLQRQLLEVGPVLAEFDTEHRAAMRALLLPRLFPRVLEDSDPLKEPPWPDPNRLAEMLLAGSLVRHNEGRALSIIAKILGRLANQTARSEEGG